MNEIKVGSTVEHVGSESPLVVKLIQGKEAAVTDGTGKMHLYRLEDLFLIPDQSYNHLRRIVIDSMEKISQEIGRGNMGSTRAQLALTRALHAADVRRGTDMIVHAADIMRNAVLNTLTGPVLENTILHHQVWSTGVDDKMELRIEDKLFPGTKITPTTIEPGSVPTSDMETGRVLYRMFHFIRRLPTAPDKDDTDVAEAIVRAERESGALGQDWTTVKKLFEMATNRDPAKAIATIISSYEAEED